MELTTKQSNNKDFFVASCPGCSKRMRLSGQVWFPTLAYEIVAA
jgi:hypothetical protein